MQKLFSSEQVRKIDAAAISAGTPGIVLMKRAGRAAFNRIKGLWPDFSELIVICGGGNNGGDGYVVAALAAEANIGVTVFYAKHPSALTGEAKLAAEYAEQENVECLPISNLQSLRVKPGQIIVDALLGTGFVAGAARPEYANAIQWCNKQPIPCVALDLPSGLNADTGCASADTIMADLTVCFIAAKQGMYSADGPSCCGQIQLDTLRLPDQLSAAYFSGVSLLAPQQLLAKLARHGNAHKGHSGTAAIIGGDCGMAGAVLLAAEASVYSGAGITKLYTRAEHVLAANVRIPEVMASVCDDDFNLTSRVGGFSAMAIGPGMGQSLWAKSLLIEVLKQDVPCVIDADALNLIAAEAVPYQSATMGKQRVFTPHPGEAARLLGSTSVAIQQDRFAAVKAVQAKLGGVVVLKGAGSLICDGTSIWVCDQGNPGMAVGGMGDVLSGVITALIAQGLTPLEAAQLGVWLHSRAADILVAKVGVLGIKASELFPYIRQCLNAKTDFVSG